MAWRILSLFVGVCSFLAFMLGVAAADAPGAVRALGALGAVFAAVAVGSWVAGLPARSARRSTSAGGRPRSSTL